MGDSTCVDVYQPTHVEDTRHTRKSGSSGSVLRCPRLWCVPPLRSLRPKSIVRTTPQTTTEFESHLFSIALPLMLNIPLLEANSSSRLLDVQVLSLAYVAATFCRQVDRPDNLKSCFCTGRQLHVSNKTPLFALRKSERSIIQKNH